MTSVPPGPTHSSAFSAHLSLPPLSGSGRPREDEAQPRRTPSFPSYLLLWHPPQMDAKPEEEVKGGGGEMRKPTCLGILWDWPLQKNDQSVRVHNTAEKFQVGLQVLYFGPKEIEVKLCGRDLVIHCRHINSGENSPMMSREVYRAYKLPSDVDETTLKSSLTRKGVLLISAKKKPP